MMRTAFLFLLLIIIGFTTSCNIDENLNEIQYESTGKIMGSDKGMCPCCGGWFLKIDDDENFYRIEKLPVDSGIELSEIILDVKFNWNIDRECNSIIYVNIEDIKLNN